MTKRPETLRAEAILSEYLRRTAATGNAPQAIFSDDPIAETRDVSEIESEAIKGAEEYARRTNRGGGFFDSGRSASDGSQYGDEGERSAREWLARKRKSG